VQSDQPSSSEAIIAGTTIMGSDAKTSVVGPDLKSWDHPNLYLLGTSTHPTAPINPPTLTVAALAIRLASTLIQRS
jgi:choline dehydrogenase-like flavoprotein